jgi:hypothetical protein
MHEERWSRPSAETRIAEPFEDFLEKALRNVIDGDGQLEDWQSITVWQSARDACDHGSAP